MNILSRAGRSYKVFHKLSKVQLCPAICFGNQLNRCSRHTCNYLKIDGIDEAAVEAYLAKRNYCEDIVIARGKEPVQGKDARIEYFFNTDLSAKPKRNEDGTVDFFHLDTINHCKEGDVLAKRLLFPHSLWP